MLNPDPFGIPGGSFDVVGPAGLWSHARAGVIYPRLKELYMPG